MSLSQPGSAAGGAVDAPRRPSPVPTVPQPTVPQPTDGDDHLLEAVRRGLEPGDPVAHLLAGWVAVAGTRGVHHARPSGRHGHPDGRPAIG